jgi:hypothetical protein
MKYILIVFLLAIQSPVHSQNYYEINLSKKLNEKRLGLWASGDYKLYVELDELENYYRKKGNSFLNPDFKNYYPDSVIASYNLSAKKYLDVADKLKKAENEFNLKDLINSDSLQKEGSVSGYRGELENRINQLVRNGCVVVYYKGQRIYTLTAKHTLQGQGLDFGNDVLIYFVDETNFIFRYTENYGW